ncbi:MAG: PLP-dependent transferase [Bdellovibrionales bacterium]|nr:PLP-dependent transferase [Bdellovibrionales bacterium]
MWGDTEKRLAAFKGQRFDTLAIHGGQHPDPITGAVTPPLYATSTYAQKSPAHPVGEFEYSRSHNPTRRMLEDALALMESGTYGLATSTGMTAIALVLSLLQQGDEILCCDDVYGGTYRLLTKVSPAQGLKAKFIDLTKGPEALKAAGSAATKMVWVETPTNPLLKLIDIQAMAKVCREKGWTLVVDNTFLSPIFQRPLELGADIVVHSLTKYVGGHSDLVAGAVILRDTKMAEKLYFNQNSLGYICGPFEAWLLLRSLKTLPVRMRAHAVNAMALAQWLAAHPAVEKVIYPGLPQHPQHALAKTQMHGFGGMISFYVKGGLPEAEKVLQRVKIFTLAESLGGVESLIEHPGLMTHASLPAEVRAANGIGDNFIRLSVGLEDLQDLQADLAQALK